MSEPSGDLHAMDDPAALDAARDLLVRAGWLREERSGRMRGEHPPFMRWIHVRRFVTEWDEVGDTTHRWEQNVSKSYTEARLKALASPNYDPTWASATEHRRDLWPAPNRRRKCYCGCNGRKTHIGGANGIALTSGCELSMRRWVRDGFGGGSSSASLVLGALSATEVETATDAT